MKYSDSKPESKRNCIQHICSTSAVILRHSLAHVEKKKKKKSFFFSFFFLIFFFSEKISLDDISCESSIKTLFSEK